MFVNISSNDKVKESDYISDCFVRPNGTGFSINMALAKLITKNYSNQIIAISILKLIKTLKINF